MLIDEAPVLDGTTGSQQDVSMPNIDLADDKVRKIVM
jgi:hypothetical protein